MFRRLLRWLFAPVEPPPPPPKKSLLDDRFARPWIKVAFGLQRRDSCRSGLFVYQALAMQLCLGTLKLDQVTELLDSTLGAHVAAQHRGEKSDLDCRRVRALTYEMLQRRRRRRAFRPVLHRPSEN